MPTPRAPGGRRPGDDITAGLGRLAHALAARPEPPILYRPVDAWPAPAADRAYRRRRARGGRRGSLRRARRRPASRDDRRRPLALGRRGCARRLPWWSVRHSSTGCSAPDEPVIAVVAPPGYGKSTLLAAVGRASRTARRLGLVRPDRRRPRRRCGRRWSRRSRRIDPDGCGAADHLGGRRPIVVAAPDEQAPAVRAADRRRARPAGGAVEPRSRGGPSPRSRRRCRRGGRWRWRRGTRCRSRRRGCGSSAASSRSAPTTWRCRAPRRPPARRRRRRAVRRTDRRAGVADRGLAGGALPGRPGDPGRRGIGRPRGSPATTG